MLVVSKADLESCPGAVLSAPELSLPDSLICRQRVKGASRQCWVPYRREISSTMDQKRADYQRGGWDK
jgi:hypothetical protein